MKTMPLAKLFLFLIIKLSTIHCLFEDQAGLFDWQQRYVGNMQNVAFENEHGPSKYAFVTTQMNSVASLNLRSGDLVWRQVMEERGSVIAFTHCAKTIFLVSRSNSLMTLRAWDANNGYLRWETNLPKLPADSTPQNAQSVQHSLACHANNKHLFHVDQHGVLHKYRISNGHKIFSSITTTPSGVRLLSNLLVVSSPTTITTTADSSHAADNQTDPSSFLSFLHRSDGNLVVSRYSNLQNIQADSLEKDVKTHTVDLPDFRDATFNKNCAILQADGNEAVVCFDSNARGRLYYISSLSGNSKKWQQSPIMETLQDDHVFQEIKAVPNQNRFYIVWRAAATQSATPTNSFIAVFMLDPQKHKIVLERKIEDVQLAAHKTLHNQCYLFTLSTAGQSQSASSPAASSGDAYLQHIQLTVWSINAGKPIVQLDKKPNTLHLPIHHGAPRDLHIMLFHQRSSSSSPSSAAAVSGVDSSDISYRLLIVTQDYAIQLFQEGGARALWLREEALAHVNALEMLDMPVSDFQAKLEEEFDSYEPGGESGGVKPKSAGTSGATTGSTGAETAGGGAATSARSGLFSTHKNWLRSVLQMFYKRISTQLAQLKVFLQNRILKSQYNYQLRLSQNMNSDAGEAEQEAGSSGAGGHVDHAGQSGKKSAAAPHETASSSTAGSSSSSSEAPNAPRETAAPLNREDSGREIPRNIIQRDEFNLKKIIVFATSPGKLFGLESGKGRILWRRLLPHACAFERIPGGAATQDEEEERGHRRAPSGMMMFVQRTTAHFPLPPQAILVAKQRHSDSAVVFAFNPINGKTTDIGGERAHNQQHEHGKEKSMGPIMQAVMLNFPNSEQNHFLKPVLLLHANLKSRLRLSASIYPSNFNVSFEQLPTIIYNMDASMTGISGYRLKCKPLKSGATSSSSAPTASSGKHANTNAASSESENLCDLNQLHAELVWKMSFAKSLNPQKIVATAVRSPNERVHSVGRILGDRSVLYKYLNPNMMAVMTQDVEQSSKKSTLMLYVIDLITGKILYSQYNKQCSPPVQMVHSENWLVYSLYNQKSHRIEMSVLEFYEQDSLDQMHLKQYRLHHSHHSQQQHRYRAGAAPNHNAHHSQQRRQSQAAATNHMEDGQNFDIMAILRSDTVRQNFSSLQRYSAMSEQQLARRGGDQASAAESAGGGGVQRVFRDEGPGLLKQSYILGTGIRMAGVTQTERGITAKSIILILENGGIMLMPKAILDPRRSLEMTLELQEEGVEPYLPELPLTTYAIVNYNQSVRHTQHLISAPSGLESTSLLLACGLDLFFTQVAPSKMYDVLKEDFDYFFIGSVTIGMIVASFVTQRLANRKALIRAWQQ